MTAPKSLRSLTAAGLIALCLAAAAAGGASASAGPAGANAGAERATASAFVTHHEKYWSWAGPQNWHAGSGPYGITILGDEGEALDLGFSSILCVPAPSIGASARRYFESQRRAIARGRPRIVQAGPIKRVRGLGPNYFRQGLNIATRAQGRLYLGQVALDYQVPDPTYCYRRSLSLSARAAGFGASLNNLLRIYGSLAYFGPGAPFLPDD